MLNLIPISDANPTHRFPIVTILLIVANVIVFFQQPGLGQTNDSSVYFFENAPVPCQLQEECSFQGETFDLPARIQITQAHVAEIPERNLLSFLGAALFSTFLHAGFLHIIGNMLFLWIFGNNVEDHLGRGKFLGFYLLGGIAAAFAHILTHLSSPIPAVGASGAVAAVMGAYLVLFPRARVNVLLPIFILWTVVQMSAWAVLGLWFLYQFLIGAQEFSGATEVAWMAHVGGFVFGVVGVLVLGGRPQPRRPAWDTRWG